jgi:lactoylglutathione lyase
MPNELPAPVFGGVAIYVDNVLATADFYRRAFGFETSFYDPEYGYAELAAGGVHLGLASHKLGRFAMPARYVPTPSIEGFSCELGIFSNDVPAAFERAVAAGAGVAAEPKPMPWGATLAYVRSVEGTLIVLCTPPAAPGS